MGKNGLSKNTCDNASPGFFYAGPHVSTSRMHPTIMRASPIQCRSLRARILPGLIQ